MNMSPCRPLKNSFLAKVKQTLFCDAYFSDSVVRDLRMRTPHRTARDVTAVLRRAFGRVGTPSEIVLSSTQNFGLSPLDDEVRSELSVTSRLF